MISESFSLPVASSVIAAIAESGGFAAGRTAGHRARDVEGAVDAAGVLGLRERGDLERPADALEVQIRDTAVVPSS